MDFTFLEKALREAVAAQWPIKSMESEEDIVRWQEGCGLMYRCNYPDPEWSWVKARSMTVAQFISSGIK